MTVIHRILRLLSCILIAAVMMGHGSPALAQSPGGALGPFRPGMSVAEARATASNLTLRRNELGIEQAIVGDAPLNGLASEFHLHFEKGRLLFLRAHTDVRVENEAQCLEAFDGLLREMERQFGVLDGAPSSLNGAESHVLPSGSRVTTRPATQVARFVSSFKRSPAVSAEVFVGISQVTSQLACELSASAAGSDELWNELAPPAQLPEEIAAAQPIDAPVIRRSRDFSRFFPRLAMELQIEGRVELECLVLELGALRCAVLRETPTGVGFGEAALRMAPAFATLESFEGEPTLGKRIHIVIPFRIPD